MKTRAMAKTERKGVSLVEAKRNSRQRMVKTSTDNVVRDIYGNVRKYLIAQFEISCKVRFLLGSQWDEHDPR